MTTHSEFGIFRPGSDQVTPLENWTFLTREQAESYLRASYSRPEAWEIRKRTVTEWKCA